MQDRLGGDLFRKPELLDVFKGLLGVGDHMKPLECVGEVDELRKAYHMSQAKGYSALPFAVPASDFDTTTRFASQPWAEKLLVY